MAKTNIFKTGDKVQYRDCIGTIKRNDSDYHYWVVEFKDCTRILHYEDLELTFLKEDYDA
jgi:hypothetical protein